MIIYSYELFFGFLELQWLENNPLIKQFTTSKFVLFFIKKLKLILFLVHEKTRLILYQCSKCSYQINNNHQHFVNHIDHLHPELLEVNFSK